jgi:hypothetical protein
VNVEQEDIDLMAKLFDYAALSDGQVGISPDMNATPRSRTKASDSALNLVPQNIISASDDLTVIETRPIRPDPPAVTEEFDWTNELFDISADFTNDWSFLGQRWSTIKIAQPAFRP